MKQIKEIEITTSIVKINRTFNAKSVKSSNITLTNALSIRIKTIKVLKKVIKAVHEVIVIIVFEKIIVRKSRPG